MYGRGTIDDKGPLVASLYAMKAVKESGLPIRNHVRHIIGCDEETGHRCIKYYLTKERGKAGSWDFPRTGCSSVMHAGEGDPAVSDPDEPEAAGYEGTVRDPDRRRERW